MRTQYLPNTHQEFIKHTPDVKKRYIKIFVGIRQVKTKFGRRAYTLGEIILQVDVLENRLRLWEPSEPFKVQVERLAYVETVMNHLIP
jgi:hypothetical protein